MDYPAGEGRQPLLPEKLKRQGRFEGALPRVLSFA
jgi:hypothetical protein